jgi:hypothetical protein
MLAKTPTCPSHVDSSRLTPVALMKCTAILFVAAQAALSTPTAMAQSAKDYRGANPVVPLAKEPPPGIVIDPLLPASLANGQVFMQYREENVHVVPVFSPKALDDSPRVGHIHVTVDDAPWHWADASGEPLIIVGLPAGPHKVLMNWSTRITRPSVEVSSISSCRKQLSREGMAADHSG